MCPARVALYGLGPIGKAVGRLALSRANLEVVGGIDADPRMTGLDLGECLGLDEKLDTVVTADADAFLADAHPDVVLHCTQSSLDSVVPQLEMIVRHGACVVSTCEELAFPWHTENPELAALDLSARREGVALLGTGINPGYAMDTLPLMLSAASQRVDHVLVERVQDAGLRRLPLMLKVGVGISVDEFEARRATIGHIGLPESMYLVADGLGWELESDGAKPGARDLRCHGDLRGAQGGPGCGSRGARDSQRIRRRRRAHCPRPAHVRRGAGPT